MISRTLFCPHCGTPARLWIPSRLFGHPEWKAQWRNTCGHIGGPKRMTPARAVEIAAEFEEHRR